jgi:hypothetical protein
MRFKRTNRGFAIYGNMKDHYENQIQLYESSLAEKHCCWIAVRDEDGREIFSHLGQNHTPRLHLTKRQAQKLITLLERFIHHKSFEGDE